MHRIVTDYLVQVQTRIRGVPVDVVRVRQFGGLIGECRQNFEGHPRFRVGDRVVLFLMEQEVTADAIVYFPFGDFQGVWHVSDDNYAHTTAVHLSEEPVMLSDLIADALTALAGPMPENSQYVVPLDVAPVSADATVPPTVDGAATPVAP